MLGNSASNECNVNLGQISVIHVGATVPPVISHTFADIKGLALAYRRSALATSTERQYALHGAHWERFCAVFGCSTAPDEGAAILFVTFLSQTQQFSSIRTTMTGVKHYWASLNATFDTETWHEFRAVMRGIHRLKKSEPQRKHPVSPTELSQMAPLFADTPFAHAAWACVIITWWAFLRKSNTVVNDQAADGVDHCIRRGDVHVNFARWQLHITVRGSKTNQFSERVFHAYIQGRIDHVLDPVGAWLRHLAANPNIPEHSPAFNFPEDGSTQSMTYDLLRGTLKLGFGAIGGDPAKVSSHSLRRGGATFAYHAGMDEVLLKAHGDWVSDCYRDYIDLSRSMRIRCSSNMFDLIDSGRDIHMFPAIAPLGHALSEPAVPGPGTGGPAPVPQLTGGMQ